MINGIGENIQGVLEFLVAGATMVGLALGHELAFILLCLIMVGLRALSDCIAFIIYPQPLSYSHSESFSSSCDAMKFLRQTMLCQCTINSCGRAEIPRQDARLACSHNLQGGSPRKFQPHPNPRAEQRTAKMVSFRQPTLLAPIVNGAMVRPMARGLLRWSLPRTNAGHDMVPQRLEPSSFAAMPSYLSSLEFKGDPW